MYCAACPSFGKCGGLVVDGEVELSCMHRCGDCRHFQGECPFACPKNEKRFVWMVAEVASLDYTPKTKLQGPDPQRFPFFVPQILHGSRRWKPLEVSPVAISIRDLLKCTKPGDDGQTVRRKFKLLDDTRILALGVARDHLLERWWCTRPDIIRRLALMELDGVTTPNFSIFYNAPRHQTLISIARIHHFSEGLSAAGIPVVPHVYAETDLDWRRWTDVLRDQTLVHMIAMEFQTIDDDGFAMWYLSRLAKLQENVQRPLHLVAVGGGRYAHELSKVFPDRYTITEASSFVRAVNYHRSSGVAEQSFTSDFSPLRDQADLLEANIAYSGAKLRRRSAGPAAEKNI